MEKLTEFSLFAPAKCVADEVGDDAVAVADDAGDDGAEALEEEEEVWSIKQVNNCEIVSHCVN